MPRGNASRNFTPRRRPTNLYNAYSTTQHVRLWNLFRFDSRARRALFLLSSISFSFLFSRFVESNHFRLFLRPSNQSTNDASTFLSRALCIFYYRFLAKRNKYTSSFSLCIRELCCAKWMLLRKENFFSDCNERVGYRLRRNANESLPRGRRC